MQAKLKTPYNLSVLISALMVVQAVAGLVFRHEYRDLEWIKATWFGNDWVTLVLGVPLMSVALVRARHGSTRGLLLWLGMLGYSIYNYAFYLFGAALNAFFPLYIVVLILAASALILVLSRIDVAAAAASFGPTTPARTIGGYLVWVALGLTCVWLTLWATYVFAGRPTPVEPEAWKVVAALDSTMMVTVLAVGGVLLWRRNVWGYVIAPLASIQGALYLFVLSVNSVVAILRGVVEAPGELPLWASVCVPTTIVAMLLLAYARPHKDAPAGSVPRRLHGSAG